MAFIRYTYETLEEGERQYDDIDLEEAISVDARYVERSTDKGNPFIEALPVPRTNEELAVSGQRGIPGYIREVELKKPVYEKILSILQLRNLRIPLPVNYDLERECYTALVLSYRARKVMRDPGGDVQLEYQVMNKAASSDGLLVGRDDAAANAGFTLIGYSGCGKSSGLETLFKSYPQLIIHHGEGFTTYPQIVYLVVQCPPHSNFRALYKSLGTAIDRALGNIKPVYEKELDLGLRGNIAMGTTKVRELIERFSIGIIVFDEIQNVNFDASVENSFENILSLTNQTKVAFGVVGTEDAYDKLFGSNLRQVRRLGSLIRGDKYCSNRKMFPMIVSRLFSYQWFDKLVLPDAGMLDALYDVSGGIIDQVVGVYMYMNIDYVLAKRKPEVNADYVYRTAEKHYPGIQQILKNMETAEAERERARLAAEANQDMVNIANEEKQKATEAASMEAMAAPDADRIVALKGIVTSRIQYVEDRFSLSTIEKAFDKVILTKAGKEHIANDTKITQLVMKKLNEMGRTDKRKSGGKTKVTNQAIVSYLNDDSNMKTEGDGHES